METVKEKQNKAYETLKDQFGWKNRMQSPRIQKIVVNVGVGKINSDKKKVASIAEKLAAITGQKASLRPAKKSIAQFKVREGQASGYQVTLRGPRMYTFLDKILNIALPRTRDFRGISADSVDEMGNYTLGIKDNSIFPETSDQDIREAFGLAITVVTSSRVPEETKAFLAHLGFPFKKAEAEK